MTFKPLLAAKAEIEQLRFPLFASPKIDGIRCLITADGAVSRTLKPIPNEYIRGCLAGIPVGYDGELLTFTNGVRDDFNNVQSKVMRADGEPGFMFLVFDNFAVNAGFAQRLNSISPSGHVLPVEHAVIRDRKALDAYETVMVDEFGWEGVMLRHPDGPYKHGRSTAREQILVKVKRFVDDEGTIIGFVERMHNTNEAVKNALGKTERSTAKAGLVGMDTLGAIQLAWNGVEFEVGTGLSDAQRDDIWSKRGALIGAKVTFRYQGTGTHGAPRFPSFVGIRHDI